MPSLYPHEVRKIARGAGAASGFAGFFFPSLRARGLGEEKPVPCYSAIVYKEGDEVRAEDWKGRKIASGVAGVDDASVIQSALNVGKRVFVSNGFYNLTQDLIINSYMFLEEGTEITFRNLIFESNTGIISKNAKLIAGGEAGETIGIRPAPFLNRIGNSDPEGGNENITLEGLEIDGRGDVTDYRQLLSFDNVSNLKIRNCHLHDGHSNLIALFGCENVIVENSIIENVHHSGQDIMHIAGCSNVELIGNLCNFSGSEIGIDISGGGTGSSEDIKILNNHLTGSANLAVLHFEISVDGRYLRAKVIGNHIEGGNLLEQASASGITPSTCRIEVIGNHFITTAEPYIALRKGLPGKHLCIGNEFYSTASAYARRFFDYPTNYVFVGNYIHDIDQEYNGETIKVQYSKFIGNHVSNIRKNIVFTECYIIGNYFESLNGGVTINGLVFEHNSLDIATSLTKSNMLRNSGTNTFSGDGTTTDFLIGAHGLAITDPSKIVVKITPVSQDAIDASPCIGYVDTGDNSKIRVKFDSAPASGSDNVKITWEAIVI